jgi:hypothetical protein
MMHCSGRGNWGGAGGVDAMLVLLCQGVMIMVLNSNTVRRRQGGEGEASLEEQAAAFARYN